MYTYMYLKIPTIVSRLENIYSSGKLTTAMLLSSCLLSLRLLDGVLLVLAALEGAEAGYCAASGLGAIGAAVSKVFSGNNLARQPDNPRNQENKIKAEEETNDKGEKKGRHVGDTFTRFSDNVLRMKKDD